MSRLWVPVALLSGVGVTLILSEFRWFARRPIDERLQPYVPGGWQRPVRHGVLSVGTFREVIRPLAGALLALSAWRQGDGPGTKRWFDMMSTDPLTPTATRSRAEMLMALVAAESKS